MVLPRSTGYDFRLSVEKLDVTQAIHVGHSTGGGEVARYIGRHGTTRVAEAVLIGAVPPLMLKTAANPGGLPIDVFDGIRAGVVADRSQFFKAVAIAERREVCDSVTALVAKPKPRPLHRFEHDRVMPESPESRVSASGVRACLLLRGPGNS